MSGRVAEGQTLPNADDLAERFDVSRTVLREVTRVLSSKGLVRPRQGVGAIVLPRSSWMLLDEDVLDWLAEVGPDEKFLQELFVVRDMIEPRAAALAAENATESDIRALEQALDGMTRSLDKPDEYVEFDTQFHRTVMAATNNAILTNMTNAILMAMHVRHEVVVRSTHSYGLRLEDHVAILDAIRSGQPSEAAAATRVLLELSSEDDQMLKAHLDAST